MKYTIYVYLYVYMYKEYNSKTDQKHKNLQSTNQSAYIG